MAPRFLIVLLLFSLPGCDAIEEYVGPWDGYVHPDRSDLTRHLYVG